MSAKKGEKPASAGESGCLRRRARRTTGVTSRTVSSDAITRIAADTSPSDIFLWTRHRRDCVGDMMEIREIIGDETVNVESEELNFNRLLRTMNARDVDES